MPEPEYAFTVGKKDHPLLRFDGLTREQAIDVAFIACYASAVTADTGCPGRDDIEWSLSHGYVDTHLPGNKETKVQVFRADGGLGDD